MNEMLIKDVLRWIITFKNTEMLDEYDVDMVYSDYIKDRSTMSLNVLGDDFIYMAVEWLNKKPIIDGSKVFKDKNKCIEYIQDLQRINGLEWTIARLEIVA